MDVRFLDAMYAEKHEALAKVAALKAVNVFSACDKCGQSEDAGRHQVALQAARDRVALTNRLIDKYVLAHSKTAP